MKSKKFKLFGMDDIEMAKKNGTKGGKYVDIEEMETDYRPVNWKRFFFRPKYIRESGSGRH